MRQTAASFPIPSSQDRQGQCSQREGLARVQGCGEEGSDAEGIQEAGGDGAGAGIQGLSWGCQAESRVC